MKMLNTGPVWRGFKKSIFFWDRVRFSFGGIDCYAAIELTCELKDVLFVGIEFSLFQIRLDFLC